jgi:amidase
MPTESTSPGLTDPAALPPCPITTLDAEALSRAIHARDVSCREVMQAYLARIDALNPHFNAFVNRAPAEDLLSQADACDAELAAGRSRGWMHGMPQAIKDTGHALGFPTTFGSPLLAGSMPSQDSVHVARMKAAGCIVVGKTNMPEFGLGSHTYNTLFGPTPNAWDTTVTAGGSSGGASVALALRLLPVADGSDFMGSLRNPAGWNHHFGLRPSQGRVPAFPKPELYVSQLGTDGPMGRTVRDVARLLGIQAGFDARAPLSLGDGDGGGWAGQGRRTGGSKAPAWSAVSTRGPGSGACGPLGAPVGSSMDEHDPSTTFVPPPEASVRGLRVGWLGDLQGRLATEPGILDTCEQALQTMAAAGAIVEPTRIDTDLDRVWDAWLVWRRALVAPSVAAVLSQPGARERIKPEALWEHDQAQGLTFAAFMQASAVRGVLLHRMLTLLERFDVLALPTAQVWPFPLAQAWPREIAGRAMDTYHRWMEVTLYATFAGLPAISVPAGFHANGRWPCGLQLIGRPRSDASLLAAAAGYEALIGDLMRQVPSAAGGGGR